VLLAVLLAAASCRSGGQDANAHGAILLYSAFISGGAAPLADTLAVFDDGWARYHLVGRSPRWTKLNAETFARVSRVRSALLPLMPETPTVRICCDAPELIIDLAKAPSELGQIEFKQLITYPVTETPSLQLELEELVKLRNHLAHLIDPRYALEVARQAGGT